MSLEQSSCDNTLKSPLNTSATRLATLSKRDTAPVQASTDRQQDSHRANYSVRTGRLGSFEYSARSLSPLSDGGTCLDYSPEASLDQVAEQAAVLVARAAADAALVVQQSQQLQMRQGIMLSAATAAASSATNR